MSDKQIQVLDFEEQEAIARALILTIKECPFLQKKVVKRFEDMGDNTLGLFPQQGSVYLRRFVSGSFIAQYNFFLRYRRSETTDEGRIKDENLLDLIGKWLERNPVEYGGQVYELNNYPELTDNRTITQITRTSGAFLADRAEDGTSEYQIYLQLQYRKETR